MAFDRTKPADTDYISASAANLRENFRALAEDTRLYGTGAPESSAGQNGWRYVDTATGDEYLKVNNAWIKKTDLAALIRDLFVGTVSENEGVPTGTIIESGSNANGKYVKFADGTMICTGLGFWITEAVPHKTFNPTMPASFVDNLSKDWGNLILTSSPGKVFITGVLSQNSGWTLYTLNGSNLDAGYSITYLWIIKGRWY